MNTQHIVLGGVYESPSTPYEMRVVAFDDDVVMYDVWWPHKQAWGMSKIGGSFSYYRLERAYFEEHSRLLRHEQLTELELLVHRPDLPFAFGQRATLSWYSRLSENDLLASEQPTGKPRLLEAPSIFISPFGPRDSSKPPVLVNAANGRCFSELELLLAAHQIQQPFLGEAVLTSGVGIYRSGIKKRLPTFYLWGARSRLETANGKA